MILFQIVYSIDILSSDLILLKQIRNINRYILVHVFKARHWFTMYYELTICIFDLKETCMISIWAMIIQSINKWSINLKNYFSNLKTSLYTNHIERLQGGLFWREWRWDDIDIDQCLTLLTWFFFPQTKLSCKVFRKQSLLSAFVCVGGEWKCCNDTGKGSDFHSIRLQPYPPLSSALSERLSGSQGPLPSTKK